MPLGERTKQICESMPLESLALEWERERIGCNQDSVALGGRRARNRARERILRARLDESGGFVEVPGWILTLSANSQGIQRTKVPAGKPGGKETP